jgi:sugar lactone lactonase YvrE
VAAGGSVGVASFKVGASTATPAAGNPFATPNTSPFSCAFSEDGAFFYTGGNVGSVMAGFSVNPATGVMTALGGSPFASGAGNPVGYATDASGRLFVSSFGGAVRAFTTASGIPTAVTGNPFTSGLSGGVAGAVTASGFYVVADRSGNRVGSFADRGGGLAVCDWRLVLGDYRER